MSCLEKLKNIPGVSALDQKLKEITPSILQGKPLGQKIADVGKNLNSVKDQIKQQVSDQVNNAIGAVTGQIGATVKAVKNVTSNLQKLGKGFVTAFQKTGEFLAKTSKAIYDTVQCEITSVKDNLTLSYEASLLQTEIQQTTSNIQLSNSQAKTISENPQLKNDFVDATTAATIASTATAAVATPSNKQVNQEQVKTVNSLEGLTVKYEFDKIYELNVTRLEKSSRLDLISYIQGLLGIGPKYYDNEKFPDIKQARIAELQRLRSDLNSKYIKNPDFITVIDTKVTKLL